MAVFMDNESEKISFMRRFFYFILDSIEVLLGSFFVVASLYFFFHFDTWIERLGYIALLGVVLFSIEKILGKIWPDH